MEAYSKRLSKTIRKYRKYKNYSTRGLPDKLGVSVGFINHLENGRNDSFKIDLLLKIVQELSIPLSEISPNKELDLRLLVVSAAGSSRLVFDINDGIIKETENLLPDVKDLIAEILELITSYNQNTKAANIIINHLLSEVRLWKDIKDIV
jgi:transcriptional regulator with XRE-family HTH domain